MAERKGLEMTSEAVSKLLNQQINLELYSAYLYWDFAKHFDCDGLKGFANWYKVQANEEVEHARKIYYYMQDQGCFIKLTTIAGPKEDLKDYMTVAKLGLKHEKYVTESINKIYEQAFKDKDYRTMNFLDWFIAEQAEEESNARDIIGLLKLAKDSKSALYIADIQMGKRKKSA